MKLHEKNKEKLNLYGTLLAAEMIAIIIFQLILPVIISLSALQAFFDQIYIATDLIIWSGFIITSLSLLIFSIRLLRDYHWYSIYVPCAISICLGITMLPGLMFFVIKMNYPETINADLSMVILGYFTYPGLYVNQTNSAAFFWLLSSVFVFTIYTVLIYFTMREDIDDGINNTT